MVKAKKIPIIIMCCVILISSVMVTSIRATKAGDLNVDDKVTSADALLILQHSTGLITLDESQQKIADMNNDNKITSGDALVILQIAVGIHKVEETSSSQTTIYTPFTSVVNPNTNKPVTTSFYPITTVPRPPIVQTTKPVTTYTTFSPPYTTSSGGPSLSFTYSTRDKCFYIADDEGYKTHGYNEIYSETPDAVNFGYDTINVYFTYNNKDWMIQLWKGCYSVLMGAEIGVYNRKPPSDSDSTEENLYYAVNGSETLPISLTFYHNGTLCFDRPQTKTRLQTGFIPDKLSNSTSAFTADLKVTTDITLIDDGMTAAFIEGLDAVTRIYNNVDALNANDTTAGYRSFSFKEGNGTNPSTYSVNGTTVTLTWQ